MEKRNSGNRFANDQNISGLTPYSGNVVTLAPVTKPLSPSTWLANRSNQGLVQRAITEATQGECQALLTKAALDNVATLSALEAQLCFMAPMGEARYKTLIDSYTMTTAMRIAGWK